MSEEKMTMAKPGKPSDKKKRKKDPGVALQQCLTEGASPEEMLFKISELIHAGKYQSTRKFDRAPISVPISYSYNDDFHQAETYTLSQKGAFIKCPEPPAADTPLVVRISLPGDQPPLEVKAKVIQSRGLDQAREEQTLSGMSVVFERIGQDDRRRIQRLVKGWIKSAK